MAAYRKAIRYNAKMVRAASANIRMRPVHVRIMVEGNSSGRRGSGGGRVNEPAPRSLQGSVRANQTAVEVLTHSH